MGCVEKADGRACKKVRTGSTPPVKRWAQTSSPCPCTSPGRAGRGPEGSF